MNSLSEFYDNTFFAQFISQVFVKEQNQKKVEIIGI